MEISKYIHDVMMVWSTDADKSPSRYKGGIALPNVNEVRSAILRKYKNPTLEQVKELTWEIIADFRTRYEDAKLVEFLRYLETKIENREGTLEAEKISGLIKAKLLIGRYLGEVNLVDLGTVNLYDFRNYIRTMAETQITKVAMEEIREYLGQPVFDVTCVPDVTGNVTMKDLKYFQKAGRLTSATKLISARELITGMNSMIKITAWGGRNNEKFVTFKEYEGHDCKNIIILDCKDSLDVCNKLQEVLQDIKDADKRVNADSFKTYLDRLLAVAVKPRVREIINKVIVIVNDLSVSKWENAIIKETTYDGYEAVWSRILVSCANFVSGSSTDIDGAIDTDKLWLESKGW